MVPGCCLNLGWNTYSLCFLNTLSSCHKILKWCMHPFLQNLFPRFTYFSLSIFQLLCKLVHFSAVCPGRRNKDTEWSLSNWQVLEPFWDVKSPFKGNLGHCKRRKASRKLKWPTLTARRPCSRKEQQTTKALAR